MSQTPALGRRREAVSSLKPNHRVSLCNLVKHVPSGQIELRVQFLPSACVCGPTRARSHWRRLGSVQPGQLYTASKGTFHFSTHSPPLSLCPHAPPAPPPTGTHSQGLLRGPLFRASLVQAFKDNHVSAFGVEVDGALGAADCGGRGPAATRSPVAHCPRGAGTHPARTCACVCC